MVIVSRDGVLAPKEEICQMLNGSGYEIILASLGRKRSALRIAELLVQAFYDLNLENFRETLDRMLRLVPVSLNCCFDKYQIAKKILQDLEGYFEGQSEVVSLGVKSRHEEVERVLG